jgi:exopolyphosphatase/guanosine-5'-triphosphate,3'-diphosphate pyrophosphatase
MGELVALLDFGSNAARFVLTRINPGVGFRILREERVQTRLGSGERGQLPPDAVSSTLRAAHRFLGRVRNGANPRIIAVATAAVRDAANRERLLGALARDEGVSVRILSSREEALLGTQAALRSLPIRSGVVADLGGGSLQLSCVREGSPVSFESLPLGAVRLSRRFLRSDPPGVGELRAVRRAIREQLLGAVPPAGRETELVGLGGTVRSLARMYLMANRGSRKSRHGLRLHQSDVTAIRERLEAMTVRERQRIRGLKAERADIILAGAIVLEELMVFGGYLILTVCTLGVRDGVLLRETFDGKLS